MCFVCYAMKTYFYTFLAIPILCAAFSAQAEDALILDNHDSSIVSGTITRIQGESIFVTSAGRDIEVELDDLDVDKKITDLFAPGMQVTAKGHLEDDGYTPVLEAHEIIRSNGGTILNSEALLLNDDSHD